MKSHFCQSNRVLISLKKSNRLIFNGSDVLSLNLPFNEETSRHNWRPFILCFNHGFFIIGLVMEFICITFHLCTKGIIDRCLC